MSTPKSLRSQPQRLFENYVLMRSLGPEIGMSNVSDDRFTYCAGAGYSDDTSSSIIDIGFDFNFNGTTYKKFVANTNGWLALVDPARSTFAVTEVLSAGQYNNADIKIDTFDYNHVLIAPWFDDLRNVAETLEQYGASFSSTKSSRVRSGLEPYPLLVNQVLNSTKYYNDVRSEQGRRLIVRWNSISGYDPATATTVLRFEAILYENGKIEFRYAPKTSLQLDAVSAYEGATIGIFVKGTNNFRDFSHGLGYRDTHRQRYKYGGMTYQASFTDTDTTTHGSATTTYYACMLQAQLHWPSLADTCCMFTFMPPVNRRKVLPRVLQRDIDARPTFPTSAGFTGRSVLDLSVYDDKRATVQFDSVTSETTDTTLKPGNNIDGMSIVIEPAQRNVNPTQDHFDSNIISETRVATGDPNHLYDMIFRIDCLTVPPLQEWPAYDHRFPSADYAVSKPNSTASYLSNYYIPQEHNGGILEFAYGAPWDLLQGNINAEQAPTSPFSISERTYSQDGIVIQLITSDPPNVYGLNPGHYTAVSHDCWNNYYTFRVPVRGGSSVTFKAIVHDSDLIRASRYGYPLNYTPPISTTGNYWAYLRFVDSMLTERVYPFDLYSPALGDADTSHHYAETVSTVQKFEGQPELVYNVLLRFYGMTECCNCDGVKLPAVVGDVGYTPTALSDFYLPFIWNEYVGGSGDAYDGIYTAKCNPDGTLASISPSYRFKPLALTGSLALGEVNNLLTLEVSDPPVTYVLNNNDITTDEYVYLYDYKLNIPIRGGATLTLKYEVQNGVQVKATKLGTWTHQTWETGPSSLPRTTEPPGDGQFVYVEFVSRSIAEFGNALLPETTISPFIVNYPSTLPRFYSDTEPSAIIRQDVFSGDFETTGTIDPFASEQFIAYEYPTYTSPYSEDNQFESSSDAFFASGSSLVVGYGLQSPLRSKSKVSFTLPVNNSITLQQSASAIYYYNNRFHGWETPQNSTYVLNRLSDDPGDKDDTVYDRTSQSQLFSIIEDHKGFGPIGNFIASGSIDIASAYDQTDELIGTPYSRESLTNAIGKQYNKTITVNSDYRALQEETVSVPITQPFLVEKVVVELPIAAGSGWFNDRTTCVSTLETDGSGFDFGGPGLTFALFNQIAATGKRDLITTGTITHNNDVNRNMVISKFPAVSSIFQLRPEGFAGYSAEPTAIVSSSNGTFTGSVQLNCGVLVSNGACVKVELAMTSSDYAANRTGMLEAFSAEEIKLEPSYIGATYEKTCNIAYVNPFGRMATGFEPSGRSVFGREFVTSDSITSKGYVKNPFYIVSGAFPGETGSLSLPLTVDSIPAQFSEALQDSTFKCKCEAVVPLESATESPYLLMPGDSLVFAVAKSRPVYMGSLFDTTTKTTGSIVHDLQLITGTLSVTLYGCLLRENSEYHNTLNQQLVSNALHESIGTDPVVDQFETDYADAYASGSTGEYITGKLISRFDNGANAYFVTGTIYGAANGQPTSYGTRGRVFNKLSTDAVLGESLYDYSTSLSKRAQPASELVGSLRLSQVFDQSERYWDSLVPSFAECTRANGATITTQEPISGPSYGFVIFDYRVPGILQDQPNYRYMYDWKWTRSFPFEPRYSWFSRQATFKRFFVSDRAFVYPGTVVNIPTVTHSYFIPMSRGSQYPWVYNGMKEESLHYDLKLTDRPYTEINTSPYPAESATMEDIIKVLYGIGDTNNMVNAITTMGDQTGGMIGSSNFAEFRVNIGDNGVFGVSPVIRGWKYGVLSGLPTFTKAYYRAGRYGQFRDMLEQRQSSKFFNTNENSPEHRVAQMATTAIVTVKFVNSDGKLTKPEKTWSQNLSTEATSSFPYFDGETRNRLDIVVNQMNSAVINVSSDSNGHLTL